MKMTKGCTYLGETANGWVIIQQVSMKQWVATLFTHCGKYEQNIPSFQCNGVEMSGKPWKQIHEYTLATPLRQAMFSVLKYGEIRGKDDL